MDGKIIAVCISDVRGVQKHPVGRTRIVEGYGLEGDAHGGNWHRQISLLSYDKITDFNARGGNVSDGAFGENLIVAGIDLRSLPVGTQLKVNDALLEVTQIGKECHAHCEVFHRVGDCIMPRAGIFAKILSGGTVGMGDEVYVLSSGDTYGE